ncbi:MAG: hypothetical protein ABIF77_05555 [bacterium]
MKYILRMAKVAKPGDLVFDNLKKALNAACVAIELDDAYPEKILAEDGRTIMTHEQINAEWSRRVDAGRLKENKAGS